MADTVRETPRSTSARPEVRHLGRWLLAACLAVVALVIAGVVIFNGGGSSRTADANQQQLASVKTACQQWSGSSAPALGDASARDACTTMANWMNQQLRDGRMTVR